MLVTINSYHKAHLYNNMNKCHQLNQIHKAITNDQKFRTDRIKHLTVVARNKMTPAKFSKCYTELMLVFDSRQPW